MRFAPGPTIPIFLSMTKPLFRIMVPVRPVAKLMLSLSQAEATASRSEQSASQTLSFVSASLVTINVLGTGVKVGVSDGVEVGVLVVVWAGVNVIVVVLIEVLEGVRVAV